MSTELEDLKEENRKLRAMGRYLYLTLGYYGTPFNYNPDNNVYHPITGKVASGIMHEAGHDARYAMKLVNKALGFSSEEIQGWNASIFKDLDADKAFSKENWVCDTPCCCNDLKAEDITAEEVVKRSFRKIDVELTKLKTFQQSLFKPETV